MMNRFWYALPEWMYETGLNIYEFRLCGSLMRRWTDGKQGMPSIRDGADKCGMSTDSFIKARDSLVGRGIILECEPLPASQAESILKSKSEQLHHDDGLFNAVCEWCHCKTGYIHAHHYPTPKSQGGTETVDLCPNCHAEFHYLTENKRYIIAPHLLPNLDDISEKWDGTSYHVESKV